MSTQRVTPIRTRPEASAPTPAPKAPLVNLDLEKPADLTEAIDTSTRLARLNFLLAQALHHEVSEVGIAESLADDLETLCHAILAMHFATRNVRRLAEGEVAR